jgi:hypothetical protein
MPVVTLPSAGDSALAAAESGQKFVIELEPGTSNLDVIASLECDGLPEVFMWVRQIPNINGGGLIGCTFQPMFSVSSGETLVNPVDWLPLTQPQSVPFASPGIPIYFRDRIPGVSAIGVKFTTPDGVVTDDNCTFEVVLGASQ